MVADDAEPSDLGVYRGGPWAFTPNLDGIARKGAMFLKAHSAAPLCSPSRFTMLTGLHASCANARVPTAATVAAEGAAAMAPRSVDSEMSHLLPPADPKKKGWQRLAHRTLDPIFLLDLTLIVLAVVFEILLEQRIQRITHHIGLHLAALVNNAHRGPIFNGFINLILVNVAPKGLIHLLGFQ